MFEGSKKNTKAKWRGSGVFIDNFEQIFHIVLVFPLLILNKQMSAGIQM